MKWIVKPRSVFSLPAPRARDKPPSKPEASVIVPRVAGLSALHPLGQLPMPIFSPRTSGVRSATKLTGREAASP